MKKHKNCKNPELIPEQWYIIYFANKLKKKPVTIKRLGIDMVLWRDLDGVIQCAKAACPHRGADLGLGKIVNGQLQCKYHGFCFDSEGTCTLTPCEGKNADIPKSLNLNKLPIKEHNGFIWFWYSPEGKSPDKNLPQIEGEFKITRDSSCLDFVWDVKLSRVVEGMMDLHHLPFAHKPWIPGNCTRLDPYTVTVENDVVYTNGILKDEENPGKSSIAGKMNIAFPSYINMAFGFYNPKTKSTKYGYDLVGTLTPIDENSTWVAVYYRQSYLNLPLLSQLFNVIAIQFDLKLIQPDDYLLLKSSDPESSGLGTNHLVRADRGIAEWHRLKELFLASKDIDTNAKTQVQEPRREKEATHIGCSIQ